MHIPDETGHPFRFIRTAPEKAAKRVYAGIMSLQKMITGLDPSSLAGNLDRVGLRLHDHLSPSDIQKRYFTGRTDVE